MKAPDPTLDAGLPANVDAEKTILGAVLLDNDAWPEIRQTLRPDDFSVEAHQRIVARIGSLLKADRPVDLVTLSDALRHRHEIEAVGGVSYLASLTEGLPRRPVVREYVRIVKDKSLLRKLMVICSSSIATAAEQQEGALEVAGDALRRIEEAIEPVAQSTKGGNVEEFIVEVGNRMLEDYQGKLPPCIPSGNDWFDQKTGGGYRLGKITIVAARPKIGKSGWATKSIAHNLKLGRRVVVFTWEMEKDEVMRNLVPHFVDVRNRTVNRPWTQTPEQNNLIMQGLSQLAETRLWIYDQEMDCDEVCWTIDRHAKQQPDILFVLDHFGLMSSSERDIRKRYVENSAKLRRCIKHKRAALLTLFQLNPVPRELADKRPISDDLKESKNPLEDCFACLLLHRYRDKESNKLTNKANINLDLIRGGGSAGSVDCDFNPRLLCFEAPANLIDDEDEDYFS